MLEGQGGDGGEGGDGEEGERGVRRDGGGRGMLGEGLHMSHR